MLATFCVLERPHLNVHIFTSQNDPVLTEIWAHFPPGTKTQNKLKLKNMVVDVGSLWHIGRALPWCISTYIYLPERLSTHRDMVTLSSRYQNTKPPEAQERGSRCWQPFVHWKGLILMYQYIYLPLRTTQYSQRYGHSLLLVPEHKAPWGLRMWCSMLVVFCMLVRFYLDVLVHIFVSQNGKVLIEINSPYCSNTIWMLSITDQTEVT
jgi:hypothetical protein